MINYDSDTTNESEIICPYCGYKHQDSQEFSNEGEVNCDECTKMFHIVRDVEVTYSTYKVY
jgi:uncharacterized Zn-finger protein